MASFCDTVSIELTHGDLKPTATTARKKATLTANVLVNVATCAMPQNVCKLLYHSTTLKNLPICLVVTFNTKYM